MEGREGLLPIVREEQRKQRIVCHIAYELGRALAAIRTRDAFKNAVTDFRSSLQDPIALCHQFPDSLHHQSMTEFSEPQHVFHLLRDLPCPWGIAGGWAVDLFLDRVTRQHQDIEVAVFRDDQLVLQDYLGFRGWSFNYVRDGRFHPWLSGERLELPIHEVWCRSNSGPLPRLEVLLNERVVDAFVFRRDPRIRVSIERTFVQSNCDIPVLAPELVLLYKSRRPDEHKEQLDFWNLIGALSVERRQWLQESIAQIAPEHPWLLTLSA